MNGSLDLLTSLPAAGIIFWLHRGNLRIEGLGMGKVGPVNNCRQYLGGWGVWLVLRYTHILQCL